MQQQNYNFYLALDSSLTSLLFLTNTEQAFSEAHKTCPKLHLGLFIVWCLLIPLFCMYGGRWLRCLHCPVTDFHLPFCQPATQACRIFQQPFTDSSWFCHLETSVSSVTSRGLIFLTWYMSTVLSPGPNVELCEASLVTSITPERCPFVITLGLLFLSC